MPGPSLKPALVVVGICAALLVAGSIAMDVTSGAPPKSVVPPVRTARGSPIAAEAGKPLMARVIAGGEPPLNIVDAIVVPRGALVTGSVDNGSGVGLYDRSLDLEVAATEAQVIAFYRAELPAEGWRVEDHGPAPRSPGAYEMLATKAGADGYYWDLAVTVMPTTFARTGTGTATATTGRTASPATAGGSSPVTAPSVPASAAALPSRAPTATPGVLTPFSLEMYAVSSGE